MKQSRRELIRSITAVTGGTILSPFAGISQSNIQNNFTPFTGDPGDLSDIVNLFDFEKLAERKMSKMAFEYVDSGAADEITLDWNRKALEAIKLNPTVLNDVSKIDTTTILFGQKLTFPFMIAPTAYHKTKSCILKVNWLQPRGLVWQMQPM